MDMNGAVLPEAAARSRIASKAGNLVPATGAHSMQIARFQGVPNNRRRLSIANAVRVSRFCVLMKPIPAGLAIPMEPGRL